jgi:hypothetical protein
MTIGDKIRSMTDAELAVFLDKVTEACAEFDGCGDCPLFLEVSGFPPCGCGPESIEAKLRLPWEEG